MTAGTGRDEDATRPEEDPPHPADKIYADGPETGEIAVSEDEIRAEAERLADEKGDAVSAEASGGASHEADGEASSEASGGASGEASGDSSSEESGDSSSGAPDPSEAAEPDDVIRQPEDIAPDTEEDESGEARRVGAEGETAPIEGGEERPHPKLALVYNPIKVDADALRGQVERLAAEAGWQEPLFYETTVDDLGDDVTRQALEVGVDAVLVAGGDGTVRAVSEAMSGSGVPLTIVPSGTGNLLARNLLLPLDDPEAMIRATFDGDKVGVDIGFAAIRRPTGETEEHAFVVMGGMGLDAAMIANTNPQLKKSVGWVAYVDGAARSLPGAKPFRIMYQIGGHRLHSTRVQSVLFANCGSLPAGLELIPEASVTDGTMDVVLFQPKGPLGWILVWRRVAWDNSFLRKFRAGRQVLALRTKDNAVRYVRGAEVEVGATEAQYIQLDGDEFGEAVNVRARVVPGGLEIAVPKGHDVTAL
ncbi:diacylglycerol kinase family protein [Microbacterium sp. NPDC019599]|uniref:diacylglycerol kinase family protein n=1 Tax=Microbacterium sp. NPDC019599 TaxID=3154690 RepID=UPI0033CA0D01